MLGRNKKGDLSHICHKQLFSLHWPADFLQMRTAFLKVSCSLLVPVQRDMALTRWCWDFLKQSGGKARCHFQFTHNVRISFWLWGTWKQRVICYALSLEETHTVCLRLMGYVTHDAKDQWNHVHSSKAAICLQSNGVSSVKVHELVCNYGCTFSMLKSVGDTIYYKQQHDRNQWKWFLWPSTLTQKWLTCLVVNQVDGWHCHN